MDNQAATTMQKTIVREPNKAKTLQSALENTPVHKQDDWANDVISEPETQKAEAVPTLLKPVTGPGKYQVSNKRFYADFAVDQETGKQWYRVGLQAKYQPMPITWEGMKQEVLKRNGIIVESTKTFLFVDRDSWEEFLVGGKNYYDFPSL